MKTMTLFLMLTTAHVCWAQPASYCEVDAMFQGSEIRPGSVAPMFSGSEFQQDEVAFMFAGGGFRP